MRKPTLLRGLIVRLLSGPLVLLGTVSPSQSQKLNPKLPAVYITFKELVNKTASEANPSKGARLVLHNNTRWSIRYGEWLEPALPGDVALIYTLELEDGRLAPSRHLDVVTRGKLLPGKTITFTVPREDFPKNSQLFVEFDFSWELSKGERLRDEAVHRAYFLSIDMPRWPEQ